MNQELRKKIDDVLAEHSSEFDEVVGLIQDKSHGIFALVGRNSDNGRVWVLACRDDERLEQELESALEDDMGSEERYENIEDVFYVLSMFDINCFL